MKLIIKLVIWLLQNSKTDLEDRIILTTALLDKLGALPLKDMITFDQRETLVVNGRKLEAEQVILLKQSVDSLKSNFARKIIHEQVKFNAITLGVHQGLNTDQIMFSKAALWIIQQEEELLDKLEGK